MTLEGIDLLDLDRFQRLEHYEMFDRLRAEDPVSWHEYPGAQGFWNVVKHKDLVTVNRDTQLFSSETGGISILTPDEMDRGAGGNDPRGLMMLYMDPPKHTRYRLLVNKGFTPRMIGLIEKYLQHRAILIVDKNLRVLESLADRHVILQKGVTVWRGDSAELRRDAATVEALLGV